MPDRLFEPDRADSPRRVEHHARIGSTNDRARALLDEPDGAGTLVIADEQVAGRGRRGRRWASPPGLNLYVSLPLRPGLAAGRAPWLALAAALAVRDACREAADLQVKWPNDLVAADGAKVAGILLETTIEGDRVLDAVIGIGINVNWPRAAMPADLRPRATSLVELSGAPVHRARLLDRLGAALQAEAALLDAGVSPVERYRGACFLRGRRVEIETGDELVAGRVLGIGEDGALQLETPRGARSIGHGEVVRVHPATAVPA